MDRLVNMESGTWKQMGIGMEIEAHQGFLKVKKNMYDVHHWRGNESMACDCEWAKPFSKNKTIIISWQVLESR